MSVLSYALFFVSFNKTYTMWHGLSVDTANMIYVAFNSWFDIFQLIKDLKKNVILSVLTWPMHNQLWDLLDAVSKKKKLF